MTGETDHFRISRCSPQLQYHAVGHEQRRVMNRWRDSLDTDDPTAPVTLPIDFPGMRGNLQYHSIAAGSHSIGRGPA